MSLLATVTIERSQDLGLIPEFLHKLFDASNHGASLALGWLLDLHEQSADPQSIAVSHRSLPMSIHVTCRHLLHSTGCHGNSTGMCQLRSPKQLICRSSFCLALAPSDG